MAGRSIASRSESRPKWLGSCTGSVLSIPSICRRKFCSPKRFTGEFPDLPQVACFDTAFHHDLAACSPDCCQSRAATKHRGVRRYGFHGLSYAFLMGELERLAGAETAQGRFTANGRVILAHLGNGASLAAVRGGKTRGHQHEFHPGRRSADEHPLRRSSIPDWFGIWRAPRASMLNDSMSWSISSPACSAFRRPVPT